MATSMKNLDPAFQGVGQKIGIEIWSMEDTHPVPLSNSENGSFFSGNSYIVLQTSSKSSGNRQYDIHFWIGKDSNQNEAEAASVKAIELDAALGGRAVQYRELQGHESEKFLSYFRPCFIPFEGSKASANNAETTEKSRPSLYVCKGKRAVRVKRVSFSRSSLNHDDIFVLDTKSKIYQFNGATSNIQEKAKALDLVQYLKNKHHEGNCELAVVEDGKLGAEADSGEFWGFFGGFAPIGKKTIGEEDLQLETLPGKLYVFSGSELSSLDGPLFKGMLESNKCYLLDCGSEIFTWVGRVTQLEDRKSANLAAEEFISREKRPKHTKVIRLIQGFETLPFKMNFECWPHGAGGTSSEEGKGKIASLIKKQGFGNIKGNTKPVPTKAEAPPLLEENGKLEVWLVNNNGKSRVPKEEIGKFYNQDSYLVLYTYFSGGDRKEDYYLCAWLGQQSKDEDKIAAVKLMNSMASSMKGKPVQGRIVQGKEPAQFIALFSNMVILNGKLNIQNSKDEPEDANGDSALLIRISDTERHDCKAVQVDPVAASLSSSCCFLLQTGTSLFLWLGNSSTIEQQKVATRFAEFLKPGVSLKSVKEGTEPSLFWNALGGKKSYGSQQGAQESIGDPHLYVSEFEKGMLKLMEVFNFTQDDLLTEDIMILDGHKEVFIWIGQHSDSKLKQQSFEIGQRYLELTTKYEELSFDTPLYSVTEGNEPLFFTKYFSWDSAKAMVQGNSLEKKLVILQGKQIQPVEKSKGRVQNMHATFIESPKNGSPKTNEVTKGTFTQRAAALAALSSSLTITNGSSNAPTTKIRGSSKSPLKDPSNTLSAEELPQNGVEKVETTNVPIADATAPNKDEQDKSTVTIVESVPESNGHGINKPLENGHSSTYSYEQLSTKSSNPAPGIDPKRREIYLSPEEFQKVFNMDKNKFYTLPKWKQQRKKKELHLF